MGHRLKAGEIDMTFTMRLMKHLVTAITSRLRANLRLICKVSLISLFRMVDSDRPVGHFVDLIPVDFGDIWVFFSVRHTLAHFLPVDWLRVLPD